MTVLADDESSSSRRIHCLLLAVLVVAATVPTAAGAPAAENASQPTLTQRVVYDRLPDEQGRYAKTFEYDVPDTITELTVTVPRLASDSVQVVDSPGFEQTNETVFEWTGGAAPSIRLSVTVPTDAFDSGSYGVETSDWTFGYAPWALVQWQDSGDEPTYRETATVAGEGYATPQMFYGGPYNNASVGANGANATVVVPRAVVGDIDASPENVRTMYLVALEGLTQGFDYNETVAFFLPPERVQREHDGVTVKYSVWADAGAVTDDSLESVLAHEYVHTRFGVFGDGSSKWVTEAAAEYYGHVISLNAGYDDFAAFREIVAGEEYAPGENAVTLTDPTTFQDNDANYEKGAHVLAALDAEIQRRTGGERDLRDVFALRAAGENDLRTYEKFSDAVVSVTGDESIRAWLDRYVAGEELPPLPEDPRFYVLNGTQDSDGDQLNRSVELRTGTDPFASDSDDDGVRDDEDAYPTDADRVAETTTTEAESTTATATEEAESSTTNSSSPGFGAGVAGVAVLAALVVASRRKNR